MGITGKAKVNDSLLEGNHERNKNGIPTELTKEQTKKSIKLTFLV